MSDDEITLNLFIMAFMGWNVTLCNEAIMDYVTSNKDCAFYKVKTCFPEEYYQEPLCKVFNGLFEYYTDTLKD